MAEVARVGKRGTVVIPAELRRSLGIAEGALLLAEAREGGVLFRLAAPVELTDEDRRAFLDETNRAYAELRQDPAAWEEEAAERRLLANTLLDGLGPAPDAEWLAAWAAEEAPDAQTGAQ